MNTQSVPILRNMVRKFPGSSKADDRMYKRYLRKNPRFSIDQIRENLGVTREAKAFFWHHTQRAIGFAIVILVMQQCNGIFAGFDANKAQLNILASGHDSPVGLRILAAPWEDILIGCHACPDHAFG